MLIAREVKNVPVPWNWPCISKQGNSRGQDINICAFLIYKRTHCPKEEKRVKFTPVGFHRSHRIPTTARCFIVASGPLWPTYLAKLTSWAAMPSGYSRRTIFSLSSLAYRMLSLLFNFGELYIFFPICSFPFPFSKIEKRQSEVQEIWRPLTILALFGVTRQDRRAVKREMGKITAHLKWISQKRACLQVFPEVSF